MRSIRCSLFELYAAEITLPSIDIRSRMMLSTSKVVRLFSSMMTGRGDDWLRFRLLSTLLLSGLFTFIFSPIFYMQNRKKSISRTNNCVRSDVMSHAKLWAHSFPMIETDCSRET